jgi:hypothetical protein
MECPWVADGGDGLQVWRAAANILNNHSRTADKEWFASLEVRRGTSNYSPYEKCLLRNATRGRGRILCNEPM